MRRAFVVLSLFSAPLALFAAMVAADRAFGGPGGGRGYVVQISLPDDDAQQGLPPVRGPQDASRPLVVIDAGHGGRDPGAGDGPIKEKDLVLRLAIALRDELLRQGGVRVALTREDDRYLLLPVRPDIARRATPECPTPGQCRPLAVVGRRSAPRRWRHRLAWPAR